LQNSLLDPLYSSNGSWYYKERLVYSGFANSLSMNHRQRVVLFLGCSLIALMLLFPPMSGYRHPSYLFVFSKRKAYFAELDLQPKIGKFLPEADGWVWWHVSKKG
jgi:hypothetical protein